MTTRMSKITFRADDDLIRQLEEFDASKSEVMRDALREYLGEASTTAAGEEETLDEIVAERVDTIIADRLDAMFTPRQPRDVNVNISLDGDSSDVSAADSGSVNVDSGASDTEHDDVSRTPEERMTEESDENAPANERNTCSQCGENLSPSHVYCPNCGEKSAHRVFCECGDELRSDWAFCPSCGRRTPAADVLDQS
jgi:Arc/MetJ-type ribon-helix-helix transcriptional regulator/predicted RNA-binding Zn-ribbon protein involved in translation (DUF1610 family)